MKKTILLLCSVLLCQFSMAQQVSIPSVIKGVTVIFAFQNYPMNDPIQAVDDLMNKQNYTGNQQIGSVRDFFYTQTNKKVTITSTVVKVTLSHTFEYYNTTNVNYVDEAIDLINQNYPNGFQNLTPDPIDGKLLHLNFVSRAPGRSSTNGANSGKFLKNNTNGQIEVGQGNMTYFSPTDPLIINTICHEMGHSVMSWTDYYRSGFNNLGMFDLMASAGSDIGPMPINPALRLQRGWIDTITNIPGNLTGTYSIQANTYSRIFRYVNPANPKEYLIFQALKHGDYYQADLFGTPTPEGLAIWYVDEQTGFGLPDQDNQYFIKLIQADNLDQMHDEDAPSSVRGDMNDLYGNGNNSFPNGHPLKWKDGGELGITLSNITKSGNKVNFTVLQRTKTVLGLSDINGTLSPKGTINVTSGSSQSFTFTPDPGYELADILVDDISVPVSNPYVLTGIGTTIKTIQPIFVKKQTIPALPAPWQKAHISTTGLAEYNASTSTFGIEAEGGSLEWGNDKFTYVYQTINGNGTIIARVASWNKPNWNYRAGIMIRESLQENSVQTMLVKGAYDGHRIEQRTATGNHLQNDPNDVGDLHKVNHYNWLKITRKGNEFISYCSLDGVTWIPLAQQTINMPNQVMFGICVAGGAQYFPAKARFDNVSITNSVQNGCTVSGTKITGTSIGTEGSWANSGNTRDKAFDGSILSNFDAPEGDAWTGLSLSSAYKINGIRYFPRKNSMNRMVGGKFQGSNTADFSSGVVDLATITSEPAYDWTCIPVTNTSSFTYIRYVGPNGGHGNVSEVEFYGIVQAANNAPIVTLTAPVSNSTYTAPATISLSATASDPDVNGSIWRVEFYNGTTLLGTDYVAPYQYTAFNLPVGTYAIKAIAFDDAGLASQPSVSTVTVVGNQPPIVNITTPVSNSSFNAPASITIDVTASDPDGTISQVNFYNGATILASDLTAPYSFTWNNVPAGVYNITALAIDNLNASASSTRNNIAVVNNQPPTVSITSPLTNASYAAPATIVIHADATDAGGSIAKVDFFNGSTLLGSDLTAPYSFTWNNVPTGVYNITALAIDNLGAASSSTRNNIAVIANQPPVVSITSPLTNASYAAPATIVIHADATDAGGSIAKVDFYNGSTLLGSDLTAPYSYTWNNVPAGVYNITALAVDNLGASASSTRNNIAVTAPLADITGPACAGNNSTVTFELAASKRVNATGYGWYFTGSTQSFTPSGYQATLVTGNNYGAGQLCVGVSYATAPYHTTYCINVPKCSTSRESSFEESESLALQPVGFPNPFTSETTINLATATQDASIQVYNANGILVEEATATGSFTFGENLTSGIYFVKINTAGKIETLKVVKQ